MPTLDFNKEFCKKKQAEVYPYDNSCEKFRRSIIVTVCDVVDLLILPLEKIMEFIESRTKKG